MSSGGCKSDQIIILVQSNDFFLMKVNILLKFDKLLPLILTLSPVALLNSPCLAAPRYD
jgi:hypothetical protein